jgi:hypothetical protein
VLHIQARSPSIPMRVKILTFVYALFDEAETKSTLRQPDETDDTSDRPVRKALEVPDDPDGERAPPEASRKSRSK